MKSAKLKLGLLVMLNSYFELTSKFASIYGYPLPGHRYPGWIPELPPSPASLLPRLPERAQLLLSNIKNDGAVIRAWTSL